MHRLRILLTTALLFAATSAAVSAQGVEPGQTFTGKVAEVTDGDTFKLRRPTGGIVTVRLWGVDVPETAQPYGTAATWAARRYRNDPEGGLLCYPSLLPTETYLDDRSLSPRPHSRNHRSPSRSQARVPKAPSTPWSGG